MCKSCEIIQKEKKELEDTQARIRHQSNEEKLKSSKSNAWGSLVGTIVFAIWAIIDWSNGDTIGWGIICIIIFFLSKLLT